MKKKTRMFIIHAAVLIALIATALFFMRDASDIFLGRAYDPAAGTRSKLGMLARWMPADRDFYIAVDVPRALSNGPLSDRVSAIVAGKEGVAAELISALLENHDALGMLAVAGRLGELGAESDVVILAQGNFDEKTIVPAIRTAMSAGRAGLTAQNLGWATVYSESDSRDPLAFMLLDKRHLAAGRRKSLISFYETKPEDKGIDKSFEIDDVLSGYVAIGERMKSSAPKEIYLPDAAYIRSADGIQISATIPCKDPAGAQGVLMFLDGLRSLVMIQQKPEGETGLAAVVKGLGISVEGNDVVLKGELLPLISLWTERPHNPPAQKAP